MLKDDPVQTLLICLITFKQHVLVFRCVLIRLCSGSVASPTYCLLQVLHDRKYIKFCEWQE